MPRAAGATAVVTAVETDAMWGRLPQDRSGPSKGAQRGVARALALSYVVFGRGSFTQADGLA
jgi:hypothetical protein